jgi:hypothetical protein
MNVDPMAGPVQGIITGVPTPASFANQRVNDNDRHDSTGSPVPFMPMQG